MGEGLTQKQLESIQIDYGILYANYGGQGAVRIGPIRGGGEFTVSAEIRDIEYDGSKGKTKGVQVIDELNAMLKFSLMDTTLATLAKLMPYGAYDEDTKAITAAKLGVIPASSYLENLTMFAKTIGGAYKKITLYNAMNEANFVLPAAPKGEGVIPMEVHAHWDYAGGPTDNLYKIEDIDNISDDTTPPTVTTDPADGGTLSVDDDLVATFSEAVNESDIAVGNFLLIKVAEGTVIDGHLSYSPAGKKATFTPAAELDESAAYIWTIARVRDLAGNMMAPVVVNFTTEG